MSARTDREFARYIVWLQTAGDDYLRGEKRYAIGRLAGARQLPPSKREGAALAISNRLRAVEAEQARRAAGIADGSRVEVTDPAEVEEGQRVTLRGVLDRYPHFVLDAGAQGTVVVNDEGIVCVHMDRVVEGAEAWDNELQITDGDLDCAPDALRAAHDGGAWMAQAALLGYAFVTRAAD